MDFKPPFQIKQIDHVVIKVRDMEKALTFYQDILGAILEREVAEIGLKQLRAGRSLIDLVPQDDKTHSQNMEHFALVIDPFNADDIATYLEERDIKAGEVERRYGAEGYGPSIYIYDPDRNVVELKGPPEI